MRATNAKIKDISVIGGAYGTAGLAWLAINGDDPRTALRPLPIKKTIEPDQNRVERNAEKQVLRTELHRQLKGMFAITYGEKPNSQ